MTLDLPPEHADPDVTPSFRRWRLLHRAASALVTIMALIHLGVTPMVYERWSPGAVWFVGTGLGLLVLGLLNLVHVGLGPCSMPTAPFVRWVDWAYVAFGVAAAVAVPEPQAYVIVAALALQAVASHATLPRPARSSPRQSFPAA
jgi:membrane-bound ClpP family serine protease